MSHVQTSATTVMASFTRNRQLSVVEEQHQEELLPSRASLQGMGRVIGRERAQPSFLRTGEAACLAQVGQREGGYEKGEGGAKGGGSDEDEGGRAEMGFFLQTCTESKVAAQRTATKGGE